MPIVIKRKVSFDFLGEEYKDAYIVFKAIPVKDYAALTQKMPKDGEEDAGKSITLMLEMLEDYFIEGKFPNKDGELEDLKKEDVADLDQESTIRSFQKLTGQEPDPKA